MKFTYQFENGQYKYTFENGIELTNHHITFPAKDDVGSFGFPIKFHGDVFHALRMGKISCAADIPTHCKNW